MPLIFFLGTRINSYIVGMSVTNLGSFFHKVSFIYQRPFSTFAWHAVFWLHKTLCWSIMALDAFRVSAHHLQNAEELGVHLSGGRKDGSRRSLNWDCRGDEGEQSTALLQLPRLWMDWCAVWCCRAAGRLDSSSLFGWNLRIYCFWLLLMSAHCHCALIVAPLSAILPTRYLHCPRRY